jgi:ketosteroid isomerase-like protein
MAHPNEELTRRAYDAFSKGDVDTLRQVFADDAVFHEPGRNPVSGDYQGIDQILAFFGTLAERSGGTFRVNLHDVVANDEHAVGLHVAEGEREGRRLHSQEAVVLHVRDGRITEAWANHYNTHDPDEFWA